MTAPTKREIRESHRARRTLENRKKAAQQLIDAGTPRVVCGYCEQPAQFLGGEDVYPHRPDLAHLNFWVCLACNARVGCHGSGWKPLGQLANEATRRGRMAAHAAFDPLWRRGGPFAGRRGVAYHWLQTAMQSNEPIHMGASGPEACALIVQICKERRGIAEFIAAKSAEKPLDVPT